MSTHGHKEGEVAGMVNNISPWPLAEWAQIKFVASDNGEVEEVMRHEGRKMMAGRVPLNGHTNNGWNFSTVHQERRRGKLPKKVGASGVNNVVENGNGLFKCGDLFFYVYQRKLN